MDIPTCQLFILLIIVLNIGEIHSFCHRTNYYKHISSSLLERCMKKGCLTGLAPGSVKRTRFHSIFKAVDSIGLDGLTDFEADGVWLGNAVKTFLDEEYLPQQVHSEIGEKVKKIYIELSWSGQNDNTSIASQIQKVLLENGIDASTDNIFELLKKNTTSSIPFDKDHCDFLLDQFSTSSFKRYKHLQNIMEGDVTWEEISRLVGWMVGYRLTPTGNIDSSKVSENWRCGFPNPPNLETNPAVFEKLEASFPTHPDELDFMDEIIGKLYGEESYELAKTAENWDILKRGTVVKWLFHTQDFLEKFPVP